MVSTSLTAVIVAPQVKDAILLNILFENCTGKLCIALAHSALLAVLTSTSSLQCHCRIKTLCVNIQVACLGASRSQPHRSLVAPLALESQAALGLGRRKRSPPQAPLARRQPAAHHLEAANRPSGAATCLATSRWAFLPSLMSEVQRMHFVQYFWLASGSMPFPAVRDSVVPEQALWQCSRISKCCGDCCVGITMTLTSPEHSES